MLGASLQAVSGALAAVRTVRDDRLTPADDAPQSALADGVQRLHALNADLTDFSRIESGELHVAQQFCDVTAVIRQVVSSFARHPALERLDLAASCPETAVPSLVDPTRLAQALTHLVGNAIAFTERGSVTVRLVLDPLTQRPRAIDVVDSTGLGLVLAHAICELIGCSLQLLGSSPTAGTAFRIELPMPSRAAELAGAFPVGPPAGLTGNVDSAPEVVA